MHHITIAYIGGGSRAWAHKYFTDLLTQEQLCGELRLYDIDVPAAARNVKYFNKLRRDNPEQVKSDWTCAVYPDVNQALQGADFVVISILPYSFRNMAVDVHYPERTGIWQPVGDTVGPGGYSRMLRTLPTYRFFAKKIREHCPDAWVINYTNPMTMCINTLYREFPEIKAFGCCHEVFGTQGLLARITGLYLLLSEQGRAHFLRADLHAVLQELAEQGRKDFFKDEKGIRRQEIITNVQGINHFTWIDKAEYQGMDLFPIYAAYVQMWRQYHAEHKKLKGYQRKEGVKFELFERYGRIAAAGDRHLAEFIPEDYLTGKHTKHWGFGLTGVGGRLWGGRMEKLALYWKICPVGKAKFRPSGEEGVKQITALCGLGDLTTNVNLPNIGQQPSLTQGTAVETNALFTEDSVQALPAGEMSEETAALVDRHATCQKAFVEAFFAEDKQALCKAFCSDPAVQRIGEERGTELFEEMIYQNQAVLTEPWLVLG